ncbi:MAG: uracil-DNA glycosylase [Pseudomonadota bacterium]
MKIQGDWLALLQDEFNTERMRELSEFLRARRAAGARIYPPPSEIFAAFEATPPAAVRVVVLGQDPYHNPGQAHGLCFSVNRGVPVPPSLLNIYRELHSDIGCRAPDHGDLRHWANQGVLLLNSVLTVEHNQPASHQGRGWEQFTDAVVNAVNTGAEPVVFMLWGAQAQKKGRTIDANRHLVLRAPHPSPLSAHRGFLGCRHFSAANEFLREHGRDPIDWQL